MRLLNGLVAGAVLLCAGQVFAAGAAAAKGEVMEAPQQKKILVVYYSRTGNTKKVAGDIAKALNADIEQLVDKKDRSGAGGYMKGGRDAMKESTTELAPVKYDPAKYDLVIMGTPVWCWNMTPAIRTYIVDHKAAFKEVAFFTSAGGTKPDKIVKKMEELSGKSAGASAGFYDSDHKDKNKAKYEAKINDFVKSFK